MTVVAAAVVAVLLVLTIAGLAVASAAEAGRRAAQAADLAALAGAVELRESADAAGACAAADRISTANGASLRACTTTVDTVRVRCTARSRWSLPGLARIAARSAQAGPDPRS